MATFAGFELPEGDRIQDMEQWPSFAEWYLQQYGYKPEENSACKEMFEAYVQGAFWEWYRKAFVEVK